MSAKAIRDLFRPGQRVSVTNHYITRVDHHCFGTNVRTIARVSSSHLYFEPSGGVPWPKAAHLTASDGRVQFFGFPTPTDLFLTIVFVAE